MDTTATATLTEQAAAGTAIESLPLRRNLRFQTLWIGMTASTVGVSVADVAYPLIILAMTGSPALAGLFAAVISKDRSSAVVGKNRSRGSKEKPFLRNQPPILFSEGLGESYLARG
jgi:hypothetical protein